MKRAFTLSEVLITLAILAIVMAVIIPSVITSQDKKYNTARLKALKTFGDAGQMASMYNKINGYSSAEDFVNSSLSSYLKITKVCDTASECNFPSQIKPLKDTNSLLTSDDLKSWKDIGSGTKTKDNWTDISNNNLSTYITTIDGFSAKVFYNPKCVKNTHVKPVDTTCRNIECDTYGVDAACMNVIYDMNGIKSPNEVGKDIGFVTVFWSGNNTTAASPGVLLETYKLSQEAEYKKPQEASAFCASKGTAEVPYSLASVNELMSAALNSALVYMPSGGYWSGTTVSWDSKQVWYATNAGYIDPSNGVGSTYYVFCVRR